MSETDVLAGSRLAEAISHWTSRLGTEFVQTDPERLIAASTATFATWHRVPAILQPGDREQVQDCLLIANRFQIPVYPISSGKNWGYGSRVPPAENCALLDLRRLDRILEFSETLGYVTVEPGVTQQQLHAFLIERKSRLWMDATGSSPNCSLIGNAMERGFGHTPYGDHFAHVCGFEVVLPTGEVIETGSARFPGSLTGSVNRWGVGPSVDGLFSQSNLGIVTRMSIWLMPAPEKHEAFFFRCESGDELPELIDALRELRMQEVLRSSIHIGNDYKVLAGIRQYPWTETDGKTPLRPEQMAIFRKSYNFGPWNVSGALYGTGAQISEAKRLVRAALGRVNGKLKFVNPQTLDFAKRFSGAFRLFGGWDISRAIELVEPILGLMRGVPTNHSLSSAYWRKRIPVPADADPDRDGCGLLWFAPVSPAEGSHVAALAGVAADTLFAFGFEPMISLTMLTPRTVSCVISISYDREIPQDDARAMDCYEELVNRCVRTGFYPYRLGIQSMGRAQAGDAYSELIRGLKRTLDPNGILAPHRYELTGAFQSNSHVDSKAYSVGQE
jgi:4-cresol dehydrogenase (hydroxylating)